MERLQDLRREQRSIAAVFLFAAMWQERFPGGWVTYEQLKSLRRDPLWKSDEAFDRYLRRTLKALAALDHPITVKPQEGGRQKADRHVVGTLPESARTWLLSHGQEYVDPKLWAEFDRGGFGFDAADELVRLTTEETVIHNLIKRRDGPAAARRAWAVLPTFRHFRCRARLQFAFGLALAQDSSCNRIAEAKAVFDDLAREQPPPERPADVAFRGRVLLHALRCDFILQESWDEAIAAGFEDRLEEVVDLIPRAQAHDLALAFELKAWVARRSSELARNAARAGLLERSKQLYLEALGHSRLEQEEYWKGTLLFDFAELLWHEWKDKAVPEAVLVDLMRYYAAVVAIDASVGREPENGRALTRAGECLLELLQQADERHDHDRLRDILLEAEPFMFQLNKVRFPAEALTRIKELRDRHLYPTGLAHIIFVSDWIEAMKAWQAEKDRSPELENGDDASLPQSGPPISLRLTLPWPPGTRHPEAE